MNSKQWINDRRKFKRLRVNITLAYTVESPPEVSILYRGKEIEATMLSICEGGIGLLSKYNIPARSMIVVRFSLFRTDKQGFIASSSPLEIVCRVCYSVAVEDGQYQIGVAFREVKDIAKSEIITFMEFALHM
ncbi:MAG: PilZ domain-containing protein [Candidatus Omnitrophota bacterium]|nr:PilZ domain-containing protein [Candidatus Omnitrophota bacterium]MBU1928322.1 PilZ domain-containing protein [Candidatus Omnitrophota bacterium]MBU2034362.1 PilZ domain-containing protein [Candidatus Omnitrophota bacterium]MBU2258835.1 PilZ domain-containing protein [Candidatus Omnitrophota bacterium]